MSKTHDYNRGYWAALNDVLNLLNTLEFREVEKKVIYKLVFEMRPK